MRRVTVVALLALLWASVASAGTYYVRKTGNDTTGDGSDALPWLTIQKAANTISAAGGHTVMIGAGTYAEDGAQDALRFATTWLSTVTFRPETGAAVTITGVGTGGASIIFASGVHNVTLDGIGAGGASLAVNLAGTDLYNVQSIGTSDVVGITLKNLAMTNGANSSVGIYFGNGTQTGITVENVTVTATGTASSGMAFYGAAAGLLSDVTLTDCTVTAVGWAVNLLNNGKIDGLTITGGSYTTTGASGVAIGRAGSLFTQVVENVSISGATIGGAGQGIEIGGSVGAHMANVLLSANSVDTSAAQKPAVIIGGYVDGLTVTGGSYVGSDVLGKGGLYVMGPGVTDVDISGATFTAVSPGEIALGIEGSDGVVVDGCTLTGDGRGIVIQGNTVNATITNNRADVEDPALRIGADSSADNNNDNITARGNVLLSSASAGLIVGSGATNVLVEDNVIQGGGAIARFRGHADNAAITIRNNLFVDHPTPGLAPVTATQWYGVRNVTFTGNTIISGMPSLFKNYIQDALVNQSNTVQGNRFSLRGSATVYDWATAANGTGNVFDANIFSLCGGGRYGIVLADSDVQSLAELRVAWDGYGAGTNDDTSGERRSSSFHVGPGKGDVRFRNATDCPVYELGP